MNVADNQHNQRKKTLKTYEKNAELMVRKNSGLSGGAP